MTAIDRYDVQAIADAVGVPMKSMLVMAWANDPYNAGTDADVRHAEWFANVWRDFGPGPGAHLRRLHYAILGRATMPDGTPYENTEKCWHFLQRASTRARILGMIDARHLVDRRNAEPVLAWSPREAPEPWVDADEAEFRIADPLIPEPVINLPMLDVGGYDWDAGDHPVHVELWVEKSTMNDVLVPLCRSLGVNFVAGTGFTSHTRLVELVDRAQHGRPVRIMYLSDFDPAGAAMPVAAARYLEFVVANECPDADIALTPVGLTAEQCVEYGLPRTPIKADDSRRAGFEERHGEGATELDALEALHPGELARIVSESVSGYRDDITDDLWHAEQDACRRAEVELNAAIGDLPGEVESIRHAAHGAHRRLMATTKAARDAYRAEVGPLQERLDELAAIYNAAVADLEVDLPARPTPVAPAIADRADEGWLYRSDRTFLDQLAAYRGVTQ